MGLGFSGSCLEVLVEVGRRVVLRVLSVRRAIGTCEVENLAFFYLLKLCAEPQLVDGYARLLQGVFHLLYPSAATEKWTFLVEEGLQEISRVLSLL